MKKTTSLSFLFFLFFYAYCFAQIPSYYSGIDFNTTGIELKAQLENLIASTHTTDLPYTSSQLDTWDVVKQTDEYSLNTTKVLLFYGYDDFDGIPLTDYTRDKILTCHTSTCDGLWTREHVYARSLATPSLTTDDPGSGTDVHNLRACDADMNSQKSNRLFEDSSGDAHITNSGEWYPGDEWKGDVARIIMYMFLRYPSQCPANATAVGPNTYSPEMPDVLLQWNVDDPVTQYELQRNDILQSIQGNRNPFIDNPYLATLIWGGMDAEETWTLSVDQYQTDGINVYPTKVTDRLYVSNTSMNKFQFFVYNLCGQNIEVPFENNYLKVENLDDGMYYLKIMGEHTSSIFKFIKN